MATSNIQAPSQLPPQPTATQSPPQHPGSPPSKRDLASWWKNFKKNTRREEERVEPPVGIFGVPLQESIKYANVAISLTNEQGESYIYGYVPIVVAKCGVFLKEKATDVEGIFRLSGSARRIKELQQIFDSPDRYGKGLDWTGYTVHDAANILRRYLNNLPQPIVPLDFYERFRDPLRDHQTQAVGDVEAQARDVGDFDHEGAIATYQKLITEIPPLNRQLLLYILDLLAVFSSKSEQNRMTAANLSAIFQPGVLSNPQHDLHPEAYRLSQDVLIFLIENQDFFLVGMSGTEADEKTVKEVQSGAQRQASTPTKTSQPVLGRSASNASAGADSLRKSGGIRRNLSVSSKNSRASSNVPSPASPAPGSPLVVTTSGGVYRSNTVPSKRSPGLQAARFGKLSGEPESPNSSKMLSGGVTSAPRVPSPSNLSQPPMDAPSTLDEKSTRLTSVPEGGSGNNPSSKDIIGTHEKLSVRSPESVVITTISSGTPTKERKGFFSKSPSSDTDTRKEGRPQKKLRKKNLDRPLSGNASAQSSSNSLPGQPESPSGPQMFAPLPGSGAAAGAHPNQDPTASLIPNITNTQASPLLEEPPRLGDIDKMSSFHVSNYNGSREGSPAQKPSKSPALSANSRTSMTEDSELDLANEGAADAGKKKRSRWRTSLSATKHQPDHQHHASDTTRLGSNTVAEESNTSVASGDRPRKSMAHESQPGGTGISGSSAFPTTSENSNLSSKDLDGREKKGPIGWLRGKMDKAKEEREERKAEKERAKSPPRSGSEHATSKNSLGQLTADATRDRGAAEPSATAASTSIKEEPVMTSSVPNVDEGSTSAGFASAPTTAASPPATKPSATPALDAVREAVKD